MSESGEEGCFETDMVALTDLVLRSDFDHESKTGFNRDGTPS